MGSDKVPPWTNLGRTDLSAWQLQASETQLMQNTSLSKLEGTSPHGKEKIAYLRFLRSHGRANDSLSVWSRVTGSEKERG